MPPASPSRLAQQAAAAHLQQTDGVLRVRVVSGSMEPLLRAGDSVRVQPCAPAEVRPGDVLTMHSAGGWVTHRLMEITPQGWVLMGDASPWADAPLPAEALVGRVTGVWRGETFQDWTQPPWQAEARHAARRARQRYALVRLLQAGRYPPRRLSALLLRVLRRALAVLW
ncbi:MAG: hypothetical protein Fur0018_17790 [Anaerolineales bacterium]